jgi:N-methylhydantoinase B
MTSTAFNVEVIQTRLQALMDECAIDLVAQSFSPMVRNSNDFACVLLGRDGQSIAQSSLSIPIFVGTLPHTVQTLASVFEDHLYPGDVLVTNDPWHGTGHLPDINIALPLFNEGELVAWFASVAHSPDIGGRLWGADATEVYEEGLWIPPMKLVERGVPNSALRSLIAANVRIPDQVLGDLDAQIAANRRAAHQLLTWLQDGDILDLNIVGAELQARSEEALRASIAALPDGTYTSETSTDAPIGEVTLKCAVIIAGDSIVVDYEGSSPQVPSGINCVLHYAAAFTTYALKCVLEPEMPNNAGCFRPITVRAPVGCVVNPTAPAAVSGRHVIGHLTPSAVFQALATIIPDRVIADSAVPLWWVVLAGANKAKPFTLSFALNGGFGARASKGGIDALSFPSNISAVPVEVCETVAPILINRKGIRPSSGGTGAHAGGRGQFMSFTVLGGAPMRMSVLGGGVRHAPRGICGGGAGEVAAATRNGTALDAKASTALASGDTVVFETAGGGGYGTRQDPLNKEEGQGAPSERPTVAAPPPELARVSAPPPREGAN